MVKPNFEEADGLGIREQKFKLRIHSKPDRNLSKLTVCTSSTKKASSDVLTAKTTESQNAVVPVEETKIAEDVTELPTPVAQKDSEEPTNSYDAPAPKQESSDNAAL